MPSILYTHRYLIKYSIFIKYERRVWGKEGELLTTVASRSRAAITPASALAHVATLGHWPRIYARARGTARRAAAGQPHTR